MKITMLCGSPRPKLSTSQFLLDALREKLLDGNEIVQVRSTDIHADTAETIANCISESQVLLLAFPLYVDGMPSSLIGALQLLAPLLQSKAASCTVYVLVNNGFYDAVQNTVAIDMVWQWCKKCKLNRGYGIGVGAGEMARMVPLGVGPSINLGKAIDQLAFDVAQCKSGKTVFVEPNFPRPLYQFAAHSSWKKQAKENGLKTGDLKRAD